MEKEISSGQYKLLLEKCKSGKHKFRTNSFGVTWCTVCGLLAHKDCGTPLTKKDQLVIK